MNNILEVNNITKSYGKYKALDKLNLKFENGVYGLLGHNGAGKSTLLKIISNVIDYDGEVVFNGVNIKKNIKKYYDNLGFVPQQQDLNMPISVESFLFYISGLKKIKKPKQIINSLLVDLELMDHKNKRLSDISGGMKQRLLIAQALLNNPSILLLDEPTAGLDPVQRKNLRDILSRFAKDRIVILATHVINDIELIANNVIFLKKGIVLNKDTQDNLIKNTKVYESFDDIEKLKGEDDSIKLVNTMSIDGRIKYRFISNRQYPDRVHATMDDVYLDWLG